MWFTLFCCSTKVLYDFPLTRSEYWYANPPTGSILITQVALLFPTLKVSVPTSLNIQSWRIISLPSTLQEKLKQVRVSWSAPFAQNFLAQNKLRAARSPDDALPRRSAMLKLNTVHSVAKMDLPYGNEVSSSHQFHCGRRREGGLSEVPSSWLTDWQKLRLWEVGSLGRGGVHVGKGLCDAATTRMLWVDLAMAAVAPPPATGKCRRIGREMQ